MGETAIENKMCHIFYGDETHEALDPDFILFEDQFLLGPSKFTGMFALGGGLEDDVAPGGAEGRRVIPSVLHRHKTLNIYAGEGSLEKATLSRKSLHVRNRKITGWTLLTMSKTVLKTARK